MKVKELIELLSKLDEESKIMLSSNGGEYEDEMSGEIEVKDGEVWFLD